MNNLSKLRLDVIYIDEIYKSKDFDPKYRNEWWYDALNRLAVFVEKKLGTDYNGARMIIITSDDYSDKQIEAFDAKIKMVMEMIASFNDEATLIMSVDKKEVFSQKYSDMNMYYLFNVDDSDVYVYENNFGSFILDEYSKEETK